MSNQPGHITPRQALRVFKKLKKCYPAASIALHFGNPLELLIATVLSAQCTDRRVNTVTADLFKNYRDVYGYAGLTPAMLEPQIRSTGFYRNKAKNIITDAKKIIADFGAKVPDTMEELLSLPGVARKTANIVLTEGFAKVEGIAVDTHVRRLSLRLGFTQRSDPDKIEKDLMGLFNRKIWPSINRVLIAHGRNVCLARRPKCLQCLVNDDCPFGKDACNC